MVPDTDLLPHLSAFSPVILLCCLMFADIIMGTLSRVSTGTISSSASWKGIARKSGTLLIVAVGYASQLIVPDVSVGRITAGFFCVPEFLSLFENAARMGIKIPPIFSVVTGKLADKK